MSDRSERTDRPNRLLPVASALAVVFVVFFAPWAGAARIELPAAPVGDMPAPLPIEVPEVPIEVPEVPIEVPEVPEVPVETPELPVEAPVDAVPEVVTVPVPIEELADTAEVSLPVPVEDAVDTAEDTVGGVTDGASDTIDDVNDTVDETTGGVPDVVDDVTDTVGEVTEDVTDTVGGATDDVTGTVDEVTDPVTGTVDDVTGPVNDAVENAKDQLGNNATTVVDKVQDTVDSLLNGSTPGTDPGDVPRGAVAGGDGLLDPAAIEALVRAAGTKEPSLVDGFAGASPVVASPATTRGATSDAPAAASALERIARSATEVAERIAFPLFLAVAVGLFVVVQNRVDRRDPKLALAALDADEDLLRFD
ncbi:MAG: hypothetical protein M3273_03155 [Actinomycetota bacterium]|nr:hypothetical protein [Actinomycetota bacterium]